MNSPMTNPLVSLCVLRWSARVLSILAVGVVLLFAFGEEVVVARKIPALFEKQHHGLEEEFYADLLAHLIKTG